MTSVNSNDPYRAERRHALLTAFAFACVLAGILLAAYLLWGQ